MKRLLVILFFISLNGFSQGKKSDLPTASAAGVLGGALTFGALTPIVIEQFEHEAVEWVLSNDTLREFKLKLMQFEATKIDNFNNISAVPFIVQPTRLENSYVLLFVLSPGWWNQYGVEYTKIKPLIINRKLWDDITLKYLNISGLVQVESLNKIPTFRIERNPKNISQDDIKSGKIIVRAASQTLGDAVIYRRNEEFKNFSEFHDITKNKIQFSNPNFGVNESRALIGKSNKSEGPRLYEFPLRSELSGDSHIIGEINEELLIDFNEKNLNFFLKATGDLFRLKRTTFVKITQELYKKGSVQF